MKGIALLAAAASITCAVAQTETPSYSFRWHDIPFRQALDEVARAFNVGVYLADAPAMRITAEMRVTDFESALRILARMNRGTPWLHLNVGSADPPFDQVEMAVRAVTALDSLPFVCENASAGRIYSWDVASEKTRKTELRTIVYFVGRPRLMAVGEASSARIRAAGGLSIDQMQAVFNAMLAMTPDQRKSIADLLKRCDAQSPDALDEPSADG